ncbi:Shedu immune nuclease family protein [Lacrimispora algidixylanolytica]|uniref:Shedu protein SduA C-terminal domain-containing protein n=1 Tax=Lacrimispora algidixylanolytica TaxID=94868 RepID=A0A419SUK6_9FIRM|nr:Shedu immune nuclease family protein [Lacrimispora algidixylanolytica]RKD28878.1 hypothetical protein BET01_09040 [Lacrimispora algidixylanolytica]
MKLNDFIFEYESNTRYPGLCRIRTFINNKNELYVVFTDLDIKNPSASVTNDLEKIYYGLMNNGFITQKYKVIEHYEHIDVFLSLGDAKFGEFSLVELKAGDMTLWHRCNVKQILEFLDVKEEEFLNKTWNDWRHINTIEQKRTRIYPFLDYGFNENIEVIRRRLELEDNKLNKVQISELISNKSAEKDFLDLLKKDLTIFAEVYASPPEEYICFSEFPIGDGGRVDFALFSSRSRMDVTLIEIKGAEFELMVNNGGYYTFSKKMEIAISQIKARSGYVHRNYSEFRKYVHQVRQEVEGGNRLYNSLIGPKGNLLVDPNKDINIRYIVIGGRTNDDLRESWKRHEYECSNNPPMHIETWNSFIRRMSRS